LSFERKILIVEDEPSSLWVLAGLLKDYTLLIAETLKEALKILYEEEISLAIIDIRLSKKESDRSGLALIKVCKELKIPVIVVSAINDENVIANAQKLGANEYLIKPIDAKKFQSIVKFLLTKN